MPNNYVSLIDVKGDVYSVKDISIHNTLGVANGIATLDETGKVPNEQLSIATQTNDGLMSKEDKTLFDNIPNQIIGENLLPYPYNETTHTQYDVTWTDNGDGTITANGTNTDTSKTSQFYFNVDTPLDLKPNTTYTLSGCSGGGATSTYRIRIIINYQKDGQVQYSDVGNGVTFTTPSNYIHCRIMIDINSGVTINNLIFKPMLEIGTVAHPYQPYILSRQKLREDINNMGSGGSDVTVTPTLTSGTKIGTITVDGEAKELYAPIETYVKQTFTALNENYNILLSYNKKNNRDETSPVRKAYDFTANPGTGALFAMGYDRNDITGKTIDVNNFTLSTGSPHCMKYIEKTDGGSANITNIPVTGKAFLLDVDLIRWASTTDYITRQIFTSLGDAYVEYIRYCNKGTWGDWSKRFEYTHPSYTARTGKPTGNQTPAFGGTATVSQVTSDAIGHVTGMTDRTITIPSTLSNGTGTAGLIKTSSTVTSNSGYTACPVISGVPYYKDTDTTYSVMTGASSSAAGKDGLVPAPAAGAQSKFLRGDGTWQTVSGSSVSVVNNLTSTSTTAALSANQGKVLNEKIDGLRAHAYSLLIDEIVASTSATNYTTYNSRSLANYDIISIRIGPSESSVYDTLTIPIAYFKRTGVTYYGRLDGSRMMTIKYVNNTTVALSITSGTAVINMDGFTLDNVSF